MIQAFVDRYQAREHELRARFAERHPGSYESIVKAVVELLHDPDDYGSIDPERIHAIDDGDYQGILLFVIAASGYQPSDYWYVRVGYGSCSGCDTLEAIREEKWDDPPSTRQVEDYLTLALHVVQGLRPMQEYI